MEPIAPAAAPMTNTCAIARVDAPVPSSCSHPRRGGENAGATCVRGE